MRPPFDHAKLDRLLGEGGIDAIVATSRFNVQYLLGGYRYFFFENMDPIGIGRYLPAVGYVPGNLEQSFYVGAGNEAWGHHVHPLWVAMTSNVSWSATDTARELAMQLRKRGLEQARVGIEPEFLPATAARVLQQELPNVVLVDASLQLEELRAVKTPTELALLREASDGIVASMRGVFDLTPPGATGREIVEEFRRQQTRRGLTFEYSLINIGVSLQRAPSDVTWEDGQLLCLDSGGMKRGYIGDVARVAFRGEPDAVYVDLLEQVDAVQQAARQPIRSGAIGRSIYDAALAELADCANASEMTFLAHGMGLITHEAPRLTSTGPVPYPDTHAGRPLETGMVLSIETWVESHRYGFIKLEDTVVVTDDSWEAFGDDARGWNIVGA